MKTALFIIIGLMASVGLGYILVMVQRWVLRPSVPGSVAVLLPVFAYESDVEQRLRSTYTDLISGTYGSKPLMLIVNFGTDEETLNVCLAFCNETMLARVCNMSEVEGILQGLQSERPVLY